jgi:myosin heavy subunit
MLIFTLHSIHPTAGKTETTKKVLTFLANVAPDTKAKKSANEPGIEDKILQSNPLLEALGNAKTLRNSKFFLFWWTI